MAHGNQIAVSSYQTMVQIDQQQQLIFVSIWRWHIIMTSRLFFLSLLLLDEEMKPFAAPGNYSISIIRTPISKSTKQHEFICNTCYNTDDNTAADTVSFFKMNGNNNTKWFICIITIDEHSFRFSVWSVIGDFYHSNF